MPVRFYLYPVPNKKNEYPIRVSVSIGRQRYMTGIGFNCTKDAWEDGRVKPRYTNSSGVSSTKINALISKIQAYFFDYEGHLDGTPTLDELRNQYEIASGKKENDPKAPVAVKTLFDDFDQFVREESIANQWAYATLQCWKTFRHHLETFNKRIRYDDFDEEGINKFVRFLRVRQNLEEKTVQKQFNNLKWFLNWTIRKGYCKQEQINRYRPKFKILEKPVIFLTKEELLKDEIYKGNLALPVITNQKMNYYLKDLCELCGFNELISRTFYRAGQKVEELVPKYTLIGTHAGRRTFICFALSQGIPPQVVMKWTGHSDYKAMKPYIDIAEKVKAQQMAVFEMGLNEQ